MRFALQHRAEIYGTALKFLIAFIF